MNIQMTQQVQRQNLGIAAAPHLHSRLNTQRIMLITAVALLPGFIAMVIFMGFGIIWQFLISITTALLCEMACAKLRHRALLTAVKDMSLLITCLILVMTLPPLLPWYLNVAATAFAILLVKEAFGGLGMNIFNPAMAGFIFLFISASNFMFATWVSPNANALQLATPATTYEVIFNKGNATALRDKIHAQAQDVPDAFTGATWLDSVKTARKAGTDIGSEAVDFSSESFWGYVVISSALALGGLILMALRIVIIRMVVAYFAAIVLFSALGYAFCPEYFLPPLHEILFGGTVIAGFFIITDPVTNAGTAKGRIVYAVLVAFLIILIRALGSYSDAVAFSVLLANAAAPLIDVLTRRHGFGYGYKKGSLD